MQFLCLNETCKMICYSILSNNVNLVEIGFELLWRKTTVLCVLMRISPTKSTFSLGKNFGGTRHLCENHEATLDRLGGGVHGKVCWLIAYNSIIKKKHCKHYGTKIMQLYNLYQDHEIKQHSTPSRMIQLQVINLMRHTVKTILVENV